MTDVDVILKSLAEPGQPERTYAALDALVQRRIGHRSFTLLVVDGDDVERVYSTTPAEYPVAGRKPMGPTPWGDLVLKRRQTFLGRTMADMRWAFYDHAVIAAMGNGSIINIPVIYDDACIGTMNITHVERHYREEHVPMVAGLAPLLIPAFLEARRAGRSTTA
jgi:hypothetical protein